MFDYKISVIVPVYNSAEFLAECFASLEAQTFPAKDFEVLLIDDGSKDNGAEICTEFCSAHPNFKFFSKPNEGVSATRNFGIEHAKGKYMLFLDSDDCLTEDTLKTVYAFFEEHFDETDLVTYKIVPVTNGHRGGVHFRYRTLNHTAVYNLNDEENWYITQTTMNICVKNSGPAAGERFDTALVFHEDQDYICRVLKHKMTIGYCDGPEYLYRRHLSSATGSRSHAYYIFEDSTALRERMFAEYPESVPKYFQAFVLHDLNWKFISDTLLPYHYSEEEFEKAENRLLALLDRIDDDVIMSHPKVELYHKTFALSLKKSNTVTAFADAEGVHLLSNGVEQFSSPTLVIVVNKLKVIGNKLIFDGMIKNPVLSFFDKPEVKLLHNGKEIPVEVTDSSYDYYHCRIKTSVFWRIRYEFDLNENSDFGFRIALADRTFEPNYYFMPTTAIKQDSKNKTFFSGKRRISFKKGLFKIRKCGFPISLFMRPVSCVRNFLHYTPTNPRIPVYRALAAFRPKKDVWIYLDRYSVFDNAYQQFKHDISKNDGVDRYYILNKCDWDQLEERFTPEERKNVVLFHGMKHKYLYMNCTKLITSFSNISNICPFGIKPMRWYSDLTRFEVIYLQHGILHASLLAMYAKERCQIDRVVVSSGFEVESFTGKYGYAHKDLILSGMPRYDFIDRGAPKKNRILLSPSWRSNLIGKLINNEREASPDVFMNSDFYKEIQNFINSPRLIRLLEENDLYLDFKNHPIFRCYNELFSPESERITVSCGNTVMDDYQLMITDYSSIVFDAVYINCPIIYFVPDYDKFEAGVSHSYRELDLPLEKGFGPFTRTADNLIDELEKYVSSGFKPCEPYASRMNDFFLHTDKHCMDRIYDDLMENR